MLLKTGPIASSSILWTQPSSSQVSKASVAELSSVKGERVPFFHFNMKVPLIISANNPSQAPNHTFSSALHPEHLPWGQVGNYMNCSRTSVGVGRGKDGRRKDQGGDWLPRGVERNMEKLGYAGGRGAGHNASCQVNFVLSFI